MRNVDITAVICSYNRYRTIGDAIASVEAQSIGRETYEIIVIDNSPDHEFSAKFAQQYAERENFSWIIEKSPGLSNARNVGLKLAQGRFICFMDDDAVADRNWLKGVAAAFDQFGDRAGVVGGRVDPIWEAPRPNWLHDDFLGHLSLVDWKGAEPRIAGPREWAVGTNISFRVEALRAIDGFPTHLGRKGGDHALLSNEENDVCRKLKNCGQIVIYAPDAKVAHRVEPQRLTQEWFRRRVVWQAVSEYLQDGQRLFSEAPTYWSDVLQFVNMLPPRDRSLRALYVPQEDPSLFKMQMTALYNYTVASLTGFTGIEA
jgi:glycosyltransferase involved in cell wall biosynthesis